MKLYYEIVHWEMVFRSANQDCEDDVSFLETPHETPRWDWPNLAHNLFTVHKCAP